MTSLFGNIIKANACTGNKILGSEYEGGIEENEAITVLSPPRSETFFQTLGWSKSETLN